MSVIYNALKKLQHHPPITAPKKDAGKERRQVSIKKLFLSPSGLTGFILLFFFLSVIFLFGFQDRTAEVQAKTRKAKIVARKIQDPQAPNRPTELLESAGTMTVSEPGPPGTMAASADPLRSMTPPDLPTNSAAKVQPAHGKYLAPHPRGDISLLERVPQVSKNALSGGQYDPRHDQTTGSIRHKSPNQPAARLTSKGQRRSISNRQMAPSSATAAVAALKSADSSGIQTDPAAGHSQGRGAKVKKLHAVRVRSNLEVIKLIQEIKKSIRHGNPDDTEHLIERLAAHKGADDFYVLKLRAYWRLQHQDYDAAAKYLTKVLDKNSDDMEAGINMVIIDINCQRIERARTRLQKLEKVYPDNLVIADLMQKLKK